MGFNFQEAFEAEKARALQSKVHSANTKRVRFDNAFRDITATINELYKSGIPRELESPVADWLEDFYEHGCVWLNEDLKKLADLWLRNP